METKQDSLEITQEVVHDLNELCAETEYPVRVVCAAIKAVIEPLIGDSKRLADVYLGLEEIVKDVEVHGDDELKLVTVRREIGGVAIETVNKIIEDSESNGFGRPIIDSVFGEDYSAITEETPDGEIYKGYLFIRADQSVLQSSEFQNVA